MVMCSVPCDDLPLRSYPLFRAREGSRQTLQFTPKHRAKVADRDFVQGASHRPENLNAILSKAEEVVAVELRKTLFLPLGDLLKRVWEVPSIVIGFGTLQDLIVTSQ